MKFIAWDLETGPRHPKAWTDLQRARFDKEVEAHKRKGATDEEARKLAVMLHPQLAFVSVICAQATDGKRRFDPVVFSGYQGAERNTLGQFWSWAKQQDEECIWVTWNGKYFDCPFLLQRSLVNRVQVTRQDLMQTSPFSNHPHLDLKAALGSRFAPHMAEAAEMFGVAPPTSEIDGSQVIDAIRAGKLEPVVEHCLDDVRMTLDLLDKMKWSISIWPYKRKRKDAASNRQGSYQR